MILAKDKTVRRTLLRISSPASGKLLVVPCAYSAEEAGCHVTSNEHPSFRYMSFLLILEENWRGGAKSAAFTTEFSMRETTSIKNACVYKIPFRQETGFTVQTVVLLVIPHL